MPGLLGRARSWQLHGRPPMAPLVMGPLPFVPLPGRDPQEQTFGDRLAAQRLTGGGLMRAAKVQVVSKRRLVGDQADQVIRARLLRRWRDLIEWCPEASLIGQQVMEAETEEEVLLILESSFVESRNGTLATRLSGGSALVKWLQQEEVGRPPTEKLVWKFALKHCTLSTAKSRGRALVGFSRYCFYELGFEGLAWIERAKRINGLAIKQFLEMGPKVKALICKGFR